MSRPGGRQVLLSQLKVVQRGCSQQVILAELRRVILEGAVEPGTAIALDAVAEQFGVSRIPVREALKTLVGEDLVEHHTNAGYFVAGLTSGELRQLYLVREALEAAVLPEAALRALPEDHRRAAAAHLALGAAVQAGDSRSHHRESRRFHLALVAPAGMHRLQAMFESAWNVTEPMQPMGQNRAREAVLLHADHQLMLDAFVARDVSGLLAAAGEHHRRLLTLLPVAEAPTTEPPSAARGVSEVG